MFQSATRERISRKPLTSPVATSTATDATASSREPGNGGGGERPPAAACFDEHEREECEAAGPYAGGDHVDRVAEDPERALDPGMPRERGRHRDRGAEERASSAAGADRRRCATTATTASARPSSARIPTPCRTPCRAPRCDSDQSERLAEPEPRRLDACERDPREESRASSTPTTASAVQCHAGRSSRGSTTNARKAAPPTHRRISREPDVAHDREREVDRLGVGLLVEHRLHDVGGVRRRARRPRRTQTRRESDASRPRGPATRRRTSRSARSSGRSTETESDVGFSSLPSRPARPPRRTRGPSPGTVEISSSKRRTTAFGGVSQDRVVRRQRAERVACASAADGAHQRQRDRRDNDARAARRVRVRVMPGSFRARRSRRRAPEGTVARRRSDDESGRRPARAEPEAGRDSGRRPEVVALPAGPRAQHDDAWRSEQLGNRTGRPEQKPRERVGDERERHLERETEQERLLDQERRRECTVVRQPLEVLLRDEDRGREDREDERRGARRALVASAVRRRARARARGRRTRRRRRARAARTRDSRARSTRARARARPRRSRGGSPRRAPPATPRSQGAA